VYRRIISKQDNIENVVNKYNSTHPVMSFITPAAFFDRLVTIRDKNKITGEIT
jgi:hypothetical protein